MTFSLFSPGVTYRVNYNLIKVGPLIPGSVLPLLSAVTIIVMITGICRGQSIQLGQPSVNPPGLVLEVGGTSTLQAAMPGELKSPPPTWKLEVGGTSTLQA